jgi:integrase
MSSATYVQPMARVLLTDIGIKGFGSAGEPQLDYYDTKVTGLSLRVTKAGTKTFSLWYRHAGKAKRFKLGRYPTITLAQARKLAEEASQKLSEGRDPAAEKQRISDDYASTLFPAVVDDFVASYARPRLKSWRQREAILTKYFVPQWSLLPIHQITKKNVNSVLKSIVSSGHKSAAAAAFAVVRKLFNWAVQQGYLEDSPCRGLSSPSKPQFSSRTLSDDELVDVLEGAVAMGYPFGPMVILLLLTGQRRNEVASLEWSEIDFERAEWSLPAAKTKTNAAHIVPLSEPAVKLLRSLPQISKFVFPASGKDRPASGFSKWKRKLDGLCGVNGWRLHDCRRTVATGMNKIGTPSHIVERVMNHKLGGVAGIYNKYEYVNEKRTALDAWADYVGSLKRGSG